MADGQGRSSGLQVSRRGLLRAGAAVAALGAAVEVAGIGGAAAAPDGAALAAERPRGGALICYLTITGQKQGKFKGDVTVKGHENTIKGLAYMHSIVSPRDAASGQATGKRQHKPIRIIKEWDATTPQILNALIGSENLTAVLLEFVRPDAGRNPDVFFTIKLTNASVAAIEHDTDAESNLYEEVSFTYQKIEWNHLPGKTTAVDDWNEQR